MGTTIRGRTLLFAAGAVLLAITCREPTAPGDPPVEELAAPDPALQPSGVALDIGAGPTATLVGAGDIASCSTENDELTARTLDTIPGTVMAVGDNAYVGGTATEYGTCYQPTWGRHRSRTRPTPGDKDYVTAGAAGYWSYFGAAAGDSGKFYYSYELGNWQVIVLNSKLPTSATSPQTLWLRQTLAASTKSCQVAYWHVPYVSSTSTAVRTTLRPIWDVLYEFGVEIVVNANEKVYERFAPQRPDQTADPVGGIREFVVGTGGASRSSFGVIQPNSEVRDASAHGVLRLTLGSTGYRWKFIPVAGKTFTDEGEGACGGAAAPPVANPGGPYTSGFTVTFDGSGSFDPQGDALTYDWDFGDGSPHGSGVAPTHTYAAEGTYTVTLVVTGADGEASSPASTTATILNQPPAVDAGPDQSASLGMAVSIAASFTDAGTDDAPWTYWVNWGDGSTPEQGSLAAPGPIAASHTYASAGTYTVAVTVTDRDGASGTDAAAIVVSPPGASFTFVGAGDIASCKNGRDELTAQILDTIPGTVFTIGDNAYPNGRAIDYQNCYEPSWGRHKHRTWAVLGNHEYDTKTADPSFDYFGDRAGPRGLGYYSFDLGDWHIIVLNDNSSFVPFKAGSVQDRWLRNDLATNTKPCIMALWHQPLFMSSNDAFIQRDSRKILWDRLYAAGADVVLSGHQHFYERMHPMRPDSTRDDATGIRAFIVGTGGESSALPTMNIHPNSVVRSAHFGVIKFTLRSGSYDWQFIPAKGYTFTDSGSAACH